MIEGTAYRMLIMPQHCDECFTLTGSFNYHNNHPILLLSHLIDGKTETEKLSNLPEVSTLLSDKAEI